MVLDCEYPTWHLLDGSTVRRLFLELPLVLICVVVLQLWLRQARLQVFELWPLPVCEAVIYLLLQVSTGSAGRKQKLRALLLFPPLLLLLPSFHPLLLPWSLSLLLLLLLRLWLLMLLLWLLLLVAVVVVIVPTAVPSTAVVVSLLSAEC